MEDRGAESNDAGEEWNRDNNMVNQNNVVIIRRDDLAPQGNVAARPPTEGVREAEAELTTLQQYIESEQWENALLRLRSHPHEVHHPSAQPGSKSNAMTALHLCLESASCPLPVIQAILTRKPLAAAMRDRDGNTPLHIACAGEHAYDPYVVGTLLAAYPQGALIQEEVDGATPLHLLLTLCGVEADQACVAMLLDVAYSRVAGLPLSYVPLVDLICSPIETSVEICMNYPPLISQLVRQMAMQNPFEFPVCLKPFLHLPAEDSLVSRPQLLKDQKKLLLIQTKKGQTVLHTTCAKGCPMAILQHILCESRYPGAHEAARIQEWKRRYPLWYAGCYQMPLNAIKCVFDLYPEAIRHIESYRMLHPHISFVSPGTNGIGDARKLELKCRREDPSIPQRDFFKLDSARRIYEVTEFMTRLTYHESHADPPPGRAQWRILHAVAAVPSPPQMIRCAVGLNSWQLKEQDEEGNLPLHLAAKNEYTEGNDEIHYWCLKGINRERIHHFLEPQKLERDNPITILTENYPKGASYLDKDKRLPLHLAVSTGKQWNEGVESLVQAAPMALTTRCGVTSLYPFMIAACDDTNSLDVTFRLLVQSPTLLQSATQYKPTIATITTRKEKLSTGEGGEGSRTPRRRRSSSSDFVSSGRNTPDSVGSEAKRYRMTGVEDERMTILY